MGCTCSKGKNALDDNLNEIIEDAKISNIYPEEYLLIIKKAIRNKKNLNDKFIFNSEILEVALKSTNLFTQGTYLKILLINFTEKMAKCSILFSLLFLCKFKCLNTLKKNFSELFNLIRNKIEGLEDYLNINDYYLTKQIIDFYARFVSRLLLDVYVFNLPNFNEQKGQINDYCDVFSNETLKMYIESLFEKYKIKDFDTNKFLEDNFSLLNPNALRLKLFDIFSKNENSIRNKNKITYVKQSSITNDGNDLSPIKPNIITNYDTNNVLNNLLESGNFDKIVTNRNKKMSFNLKSTEMESYEKEQNLKTCKNLKIINLKKNYSAEKDISRKTYNCENEYEFEEKLDKRGIIINNKGIKDLRNSYNINNDNSNDLNNSKRNKKENTNIVNDSYSKANFNKVRESGKKFVIEDKQYQIFSPNIDIHSESNAENEFNMLSQKKNIKNKHPIYDILKNKNQPNLIDISKGKINKISNHNLISPIKKDLSNKDIRDDIYNLKSIENVKINSNIKNQNLLNKRSNNDFNFRLENNYNQSIEFKNSNETNFKSLKNEKEKHFLLTSSDESVNTSDNFYGQYEENDEFSLEEFRLEALKFHNYKRMLHNAEALIPNEELETKAQEWAELLAEKESLIKKNLIIDFQEVGENLACISHSITGEKLTKEWYNQIKKYKFDDSVKKNSTANFTQIIWKNTQSVGFGCRLSKSGYFFVVAFYYPKGNIEGQYTQNVLPIEKNISKQIKQSNNGNEEE